MSHIHLPDGIFPVWLWLSGYAAAALLIAILWRRGRATEEPRKFALLGVFAAVMILVMMIEIPPFSFHFNLSVVTGVILGPELAVLTAFIVNLMLALIGHGGVTVVGLNTLVLSVEMLVGYYIFRKFMQARWKPANSGFIATVAGLACGTSFSYGIIALGSPWINRALQSAQGHVVELFHGPYLDLTRLALIMFGVGAVGWIIEAIFSATILGFISRVYPEIINRHYR